MSSNIAKVLHEPQKNYIVESV